MSARIIGRTGKARGTDQPVADLMVVGSAPSSDLRVDSRTVSRRHAQIVKDGSEYFAEDLDSRNGTFLNGQPIKRFPIRHLDVLSIGPDVDLIFLDSDAAVMPSVSANVALRAAIVWLDGPRADRTEQIPADTGLVIGRAGDLESLGAISRRHAVLTIRRDRLTIEDLDSANGTWVNGTRISAVMPLSEGDEVSLANLVRFRIYTLGGQPQKVSTDDEPQQTVAFDVAVLGRGPVLEMPVSSRPAERSAPRPQSPQPPTPAPPSMERPTPVEAVDGGRTTVAPREAVVGPPPLPRAPDRNDSVSAPPPGDGTITSPREPIVGVPPGIGPFAPDASEAADRAPEGATVRAPRTPVVAPDFTPPVGGAEPSPTWKPQREPAVGIPEAVAEQALSAREDLPDTMSASSVQPSVPPEPPRPPRQDSADAGRIAGVRLEGRQTLTLNIGAFVIGRHADCDVRLDSRDIGRRHARLVVAEDGVSVEDLGAANGSFVDDQRVQGTSKVADGSRLRFATVEFDVVCLRSEGQR